jgi:hypothetical protein
MMFFIAEISALAVAGYVGFQLGSIYEKLKGH